MVRIRAFDERVVTLFTAGKIAGALHSYVGEEAVAAGVCANLRPAGSPPTSRLDLAREPRPPPSTSNPGP